MESTTNKINKTEVTLMMLHEFCWPHQHFLSNKWQLEHFSHNYESIGTKVKHFNKDDFEITVKSWGPNMQSNLL